MGANITTLFTKRLYNIKLLEKNKHYGKPCMREYETKEKSCKISLLENKKLKRQYTKNKKRFTYKKLCKVYCKENISKLATKSQGQSRGRTLGRNWDKSLKSFSPC